VRVEPLTRDVVDGVLVEGAGPPEQRMDLTLVTYFEDERPLRGLAAFLDWRTSGKLSRLLRSGWCTGKAGEAVLLPGTRGLPSERIVLLGLGASVGFGAAQARTAAMAAVELVHKLLPRDVLFAMPGLAEDREIVEGVFAGLVLALGGTPRMPDDDGHDDPATEPRDEDVDGDPGTRVSTAATGAEIAAADVVAVERVAVEVVTDETRTPCRWWVIAESRHVGRLRRVLEGPPRAAGPTGATPSVVATSTGESAPNPRR
jgi:hypothetical protein